MVTDYSTNVSNTRQNKQPKTLRAWEKGSVSQSLSDWGSGDNEQAADQLYVSLLTGYNHTTI